MCKSKYVLIIDSENPLYIELDLTSDEYKLLLDISEITYNMNSDKLPIIDIMKIENEFNYYLELAREQMENSKSFLEDNYDEDIESHLIL